MSEKSTHPLDAITERARVEAVAVIQEWRAGRPHALDRRAYDIVALKKMDGIQERYSEAYSQLLSEISDLKKAHGQGYFRPFLDRVDEWYVSSLSAEIRLAMRRDAEAPGRL